MTRKHFTMIAAVLAGIKDSEDRARVAMELAARLKQDNPNFDRARFLAACRVA